MKKVSVVIPVKNEEKIVGSLLSSLLNQNYNGWYEIIVVDDHSTDNTIDIIKTFIKTSKKVKYFKSNGIGPAAARNIGIKKSKGEIVLFTDGDCIVPKDWVSRISKHFDSEQTSGIGGKTEPFETNTFVSRLNDAIFSYRYANTSRGDVNVVYTSNAAFRKDILMKINGFDKNFNKANGEDLDLCYRVLDASGKIVFDPNISVKHEYPSSFRKFMKKEFMNGVWSGSFMYLKHFTKLFKDKIILPSLLQIFLLIGLISYFLLSNFLSLTQIFLLSLALTAINVRLFYYIYKNQKNLIFLLFSILMRYLSIFIWIVGGIYGVFKFFNFYLVRHLSD